MTDATGSTTYCYDRRGNVTKKTQVTGAATLVTQYAYTVADRLDSIVYPSGGMATYVRDASGRVIMIQWGMNLGSRPATLISNATYLPFGPLTTLTFGNGRTLTKAYDQDYAIDSISGTPAGALTLDFEVDVMGNIKKASGTLNPTTYDRAYGYDALYHLKTSQTDGAPPSPLESYTYNKTGDRKSASLNGGPASAYDYTDAGTHHLTNVGGVVRTYDGNGNTLTGTSPGLTLTYDDRNRLASMVNGTTSATYAITGRGERVGKTVTVSGTPTTTLFAYDEGGRLIGEYDGAGTLQAEYIYLDSIPVGVFKGGVLYYVETDHLGTPRQVVKPATNAVVWKWDFLQNTFGNSAPDQDPDGDTVPFVFAMRFPGQYADTEAETNYNQFRDYEASTGRYIESDLIGLRGGVSTYSYAHSRPQTIFDPLGLLSSIQWCLEHPEAALECQEILPPPPAPGPAPSPLPLDPSPKPLPIWAPLPGPDAQCRDDKCYKRWFREDENCDIWIGRGPKNDPDRWWRACKERASVRRDRCIRNGGNFDPDEPGAWGPLDVP